ncbi:MAG: YIP1 family protein [Myxococcaceae bacterium]|nr:YIP1 family protein [Myxococcaceae bacterium]MBH2006287.1 YIP1 family protein [Myxococcaceae bacterium]
MFKLLRSPSSYFETLSLSAPGNRFITQGFFFLWFGIFSEQATLYFLTRLAKTSPRILELISAQQFNLIQNENVLQLVLSPLIAFFGIYLFSSLLHVFLKIASANPTELDYDKTLNLVAVCQLPRLFSFIPLLGPAIAQIWVLMLMMKGIQKFYGIRYLHSIVCILMGVFFLKICWGSALQLIALSL